jgi:hypothetical protein
MPVVVVPGCVTTYPKNISVYFTATSYSYFFYLTTLLRGSDSSVSHRIYGKISEYEIGNMYIFRYCQDIFLEVLKSTRNISVMTI